MIFTLQTTQTGTQRRTPTLATRTDPHLVTVMAQATPEHSCQAIISSNHRKLKCSIIISNFSKMTLLLLI